MSEHVEGRGARAPRRKPARRDGDDGDHLLRLYVAGTTPRSSRAIKTLRAICEEHLKGRYRLEVIDIYQRPALARDEQIVATPTLIRALPPPLRRLIGDLSDVDRVLVGLDLRRG
jgi:circadian clock protein KaiB